ncbi:PIN domain-containing protein [Variovorax sp. 38R]|uniref:PIN domain-containing protein n=1 Tax=Variovorax sp. 38R TaxID=2774875 RepID=UPI001785C111|nr:PIN domain-containing protein [Variovorax sp. 38R]QOF77617.1 PIN domain-containing protein [Variovorax sp. 38R]
MSSLPRCIVVDSNFIISYITTKDTTSDDRARIDHFISEVDKLKVKIIFPMISISEFLVKADRASVAFLDELQRKSTVFVADFDRGAAHELAKMERDALAGPGGKRAGSEEPYQKIKVDRQIVAIGLAHGAKMIVSRDEGVRTQAIRLGLAAKRIQDLELPESEKQLNLIAQAPKGRRLNFRRTSLAVVPPSPAAAPVPKTE